MTENASSSLVLRDITPFTTVPRVSPNVGSAIGHASTANMGQRTTAPSAWTSRSLRTEHALNAVKGTTNSTFTKKTMSAMRSAARE